MTDLETRRRFYAVEQFEFYIGVRPGYVADLGADWYTAEVPTLGEMAQCWTTAAAMLGIDNPPSAVVTQALVAYSGGPISGEPIFVFTGQRNPTFEPNYGPWWDAVSAICDRIADVFQQSSTRLVTTQVTLRYTRRRPIDPNEPQATQSR